jgi:hypothetical protein
VFQILFSTSTNFPRFLFHFYLFFSRWKPISGFVKILKSVAQSPRTHVLDPRSRPKPVRASLCHSHITTTLTTGRPRARHCRVPLSPPRHSVMQGTASSIINHQSSATCHSPVVIVHTVYAGAQLKHRQVAVVPAAW